MSLETHVPIRVATLRGDLKIPFDVFVRVAGKYILYCRRGDSFEGKRLERLMSKKLKKMYITPEDEIPYRQYLEQSIDSAYKPGKPLDVRAEVIQGFQQAAAEQYMDAPLDEFPYQHVRGSVQRFVDFLEHEKDGTRAILAVPNTDQSVTHHCVNVATISAAMVLASKLRDGAPLQLLTMGCLLHDIDHYITGFDVTRPTFQMPKDEYATYREHPLRGASYVQTAKFVDQLVLQIILQHEETMNGSGFPKGLHEDQMDPLVMVAATANAYERLVSFERMSAKEAIKHLFIEKLGLYPLGLLQDLQKTLKDRGVI